MNAGGLHISRHANQQLMGLQISQEFSGLDLMHREVEESWMVVHACIISIILCSMTVISHKCHSVHTQRQLIKLLSGSG